MEESPPDKTARSILLDQVDDLYSNLGYANWAAIFISFFLVWILWSVAPRGILLYWESCILSISIAGLVASALYKRSVINEHNVRFWLNVYIAGVLLAGITWGLLLLFVVPVEKTVYLLASIFMLAGLVTGSAASLSSLKFGFAFFSVPAILPGALYLIYLNQTVSYVIGCALFVFLVFIVFFALHIHTTIYYSLKKQMEVSNKLSQAQTEKAELEKKAAALKDQLQQAKDELEELKTSRKHRNHAASLARRVQDLKSSRFYTLLEDLPGGVWDMNVRSGELVFSDGWLEMLGYDAEDQKSHVSFWESLLHPDDKLNVLNKLHAFANGTMLEFSSSHRIRARSGDWIWVMARAQGVIWGSHGELLNVVGMEMRVPDSDKDAGKFLDGPHFDITAWLSPEASFDQRLRQLVKTAGVDGIEHSLLHVRVIEVNDDPAGSPSLDEIRLFELGRALLREFRHGDAIMRLHDDSFALLMAFCSLEEAWEKAVALQKALHRLHINYKGRRYSLAAGIGITPIAAPARGRDELLRDAETACDLAISDTSNLIYAYQRDNAQLGSNMFEKYIAQKILDCLENNRIRITAAPLQALLLSRDDTESIYAVNVALEQDENELFTGVDIQSIALKSNLAARIDMLVARNMIEWLAQNGGHGGAADPVYLYECHEESCLNDDFLATVKQELEQLPAVRGSLCFGISEKIYSENTDAIMRFIRNAKAAGCRIALTKFGSSSVVNRIVRECPLDYLKIDRSLTWDMESNKSNYITVKFINDILHLAGVKSIVEDTDSRFLPDTLHSIAADYLQSELADLPVQNIK